MGGGRAHLPQPLRAHRLALPGTRPVHPHRPPPAPCSLLYAPCPLPPATYLDEHSFFPSPPLPLTPQSSPLPLPSLLPRRSRLSSTAALPPWPALTSMQSRSVRSRSLRQRSTPPYILQRLIPLAPVTPLASLTPLHISRYPLTSDCILSQAFETTLALSDEAKKEAAAEGAFVDQSVLILSSSQWSVVSSQ